MNIDGATALYSVVGKPVEHSLSPAIHNFLFRRFKVNAVYVALPVEASDFAQLLAALGKTSFRGLNITTPHKVRALESLTGLGSAAVTVGAANTLVRDGLGYRGLNTDGAGFCDFIEKELSLPLDGINFCILGAGPAARAVIHELHRRKVRTMSVINRSREVFCSDFFKKVMADSYLIRGLAGSEWAAHGLSSADILINATSWGLGGRTETEPPWQLEEFSGKMVIDLNYLPSEEKTSFMKLFGETVVKHDGSGMLRWQAGHAFEAWTGIKLTSEDHKALKAHLAGLDRP